jgi:dTDP-4-dehydrorhamnose reductase
MRFAVIGDRGMFGKEMKEFLLSNNEDVTGFNRDSLNLDDSPELLARVLDGFSVIINAVAYTAVDKAESEPAIATLANGEYAGKLSKVAKIAGAAFMHISTDYVFDGHSERPYSTDDVVNPKSVYGSSKLLGENLVADSGSNYTIFRTAWLYGKHGRCFPKVIFEKATRGEQLRVVNDQFGQPTWTKDLAQQVLSFSRASDPPNIVHAVSSGRASWFEFAKEIVGDYTIEAVSSTDFVTAATRPKFSVLDNRNEVVTPIGDWRDRWHVAREEVLEAI